MRMDISASAWGWLHGSDMRVHGDDCIIVVT